MKTTSIRNTCALLCALTFAANAADQPGVRAALQPLEQRKAAPKIVLKDASSKTVDLSDYRGNVVLLDFWATWCHGCKEEIPWFSEFHHRYSTKGLTILGVSMDEDGWKVVRPFVKAANIPYAIVLGYDQTGKNYGIEEMPDTFLIDRDGRIAAAYHGLVDRQDIEANIKVMLSQR